MSIHKNAVAAKAGRTSSAGKSSAAGASAVAAKKFDPDDAPQQELIQHLIEFGDGDEREEALLDNAITETFPASDPIALPTHEEEQQRRNKHLQHHALDEVAQTEETLLDEAIGETFPASDPISLPTYEEEQARRNARRRND